MRVSEDQIRRREEEILELLQASKRLSIQDIAERFGISAGSVRRQIGRMEEEGKIIRTYGGIVLASESGYEEDLKDKIHQRLPEKRAIATEARKLIREGDIIFLGGGSTIFELAKLLREASNLVVVTTSVPVAHELYQNPNIEVHIVGGLIRSVTGSVIGPQTRHYFDAIHCHKAFIGADSISLEAGITTPSHFEVEVERMIIDNSSKTYILADHSKFKKVTFTPLAALQEISCIITDWQADLGYLEEMKKTGIQVICVQNHRSTHPTKKG